MCLVLKHCWWTPHCTAMQALHRSAILSDGHTDTWKVLMCHLSHSPWGVLLLSQACCAGISLQNFCVYFRVYFSFNGAPSTIKDVCHKDVKFAFLISHRAFFRISYRKVSSPLIIPCCNIFFPLNFYLVFICAMPLSVHKLQADCHTGKSSSEDPHQPNFGGKLQISLHLPKNKAHRAGKTT